MVQVTIGWSGKFKSSETDIIKSFIINNLTLIWVFDKLMYGKCSIIWFNNCIRYFWGWEHRESGHYSIWIFFSNLRDKKSTHTRSSSTTKGMTYLETLKTITTFCLFSYNIKYWVNKFSAFSIVAFSPIITSTSLSENKVIWSEKLSKWSSSNRVHCSWLKIHQNSSWYKSTSSSFIVINIDSFKLKIRITMISTSRINTMLIRHDFPEFCSNLVTTLTGLDMY